MSDFYKLPILSLANIIYIKLRNFPYIKQKFNECPYVISSFLLLILLLTSFIEYNFGHFFIILVIFLQNILRTDTDIQILERIAFFLGFALLCAILLVKSTSTKILIGIFGLCIYLFIDLIILSSDTQKRKQQFLKIKKTYFISIMIASLLFLWTETEKSPEIKYVKLFRKKF